MKHFKMVALATVGIAMLSGTPLAHAHRSQTTARAGLPATGFVPYSLTTIRPVVDVRLSGRANPARKRVYLRGTVGIRVLYTAVNTTTGEQFDKVDEIVPRTWKESVRVRSNGRWRKRVRIQWFVRPEDVNRADIPCYPQSPNYCAPYSIWWSPTVTVTGDDGSAWRFQDYRVELLQSTMDHAHAKLRR
jgi:hypothetical protein